MIVQWSSPHGDIVFISVIIANAEVMLIKMTAGEKNGFCVV